MTMTLKNGPAKTGTEFIDNKLRRETRGEKLAKRANDCEYHVARSREEFDATFQLIHRAYLRQGLTRPNRHHLRILPHQLLQTSWAFNAVHCGSVVATLSLVEDGCLRLPMEALYGTEIDNLRQAGKPVAELTCLAHQPYMRKTMWDRGKLTSTLGILIGHVLNFAMHRNVDTLVIGVHPRHASFYRRRYGFTEMGPERSCPWAGNHPARALQLNRSGLCKNVLRDRGNLMDKSLYNRVMKAGPIPSSVSTYYRNLLTEISPIASWEHRTKTA